jgi:steroid delta-isomerase-like uncharacterized protein
MKNEHLIRISGIALVLSGIILPFSAFSCNKNEPGITMGESKAIMDQVLTIWNEGDTSIADDLYSSDYTRHHPTPAARASLNDFKKTVATNRQVFPDYRLSFDEILTKDDRIIAFATVTGTNTGPLEGSPATGKKIHMNGIYVYLIKDGKIAEEWTYFNLLSYYQQLGFTLNPPQNQKPPGK